MGNIILAYFWFISRLGRYKPINMLYNRSGRPPKGVYPLLYNHFSMISLPKREEIIQND